MPAGRSAIEVTEPLRVPPYALHRQPQSTAGSRLAHPKTTGGGRNPRNRHTAAMATQGAAAAIISLFRRPGCAAPFLFATHFPTFTIFKAPGTPLPHSNYCLTNKALLEVHKDYPRP
jgi:hypothetical protein